MCDWEQFSFECFITKLNDIQFSFRPRAFIYDIKIEKFTWISHLKDGER